MSAIIQTDYYKISHEKFMNKGTTFLYSNFTPRSAYHAPVVDQFFDNEVVFYGLQYWIKNFLQDEWNTTFFNVDKKKVIKRFKRRMDNSLGKDSVDTKHIEALHDLGHLPITIKAVPEGSRVNIGVPVLTIFNSHPDFAWLTNYLETVMSCDLWKPCTTATIADQYKKICNYYADYTGAPREAVPVQCHGFEFRGMSGRHDAAISGSGHLLSFIGTDTIPALDFLESYYGANCETEMIGCSVPASEHSVTSLGTSVEGELETIRRWITKEYPTGIVSIVSDTYDFWQVLTEYLPALKDDILSRQPNEIGLNKTVIRPDSGDPIKIVCGDPDVDPDSPEGKGAIQLLWEVFGGTSTAKGFKMLDEHIGLIYGDSITLERANEILKRLANKGFASTNVVFGVGSYTYQYLTRDSFGFAMKATYGEVNGEGHAIFKDPVTDDGVKKSARGLLRLEIENGDYVLYDNQTLDQESEGELRPVFHNGNLLIETTLNEIRERLLV